MKEPTQEELKEAQRNYNREYYQKNRDKIRERQQQWRNANPNKVKEYNRNTWIKKAKEYRQRSDKSER